MPDIWSLIESSDWLTPRNYSRRFDTIFYTCYSEKKPESSPDQAEVTKTKVSKCALGTILNSTSRQISLNVYFTCFL